MSNQDPQEYTDKLDDVELNKRSNLNQESSSKGKKKGMVTRGRKGEVREENNGRDNGGSSGMVEGGDVNLGGGNGDINLGSGINNNDLGGGIQGSGDVRSGGSGENGKMVVDEKNQTGERNQNQNKEGNQEQGIHRHEAKKC
ncbi:uncharacterized protein MELLADRAFT_59883 [Melampsora larici-populina 98AG31]|uniref:Uncharacterized protein n=1 Tax=Melampsora larici-populina (strain 98AG31 / pathotype 3-4-7) TaxID=747676 RepID=F4R954_MELLP|nr:uncharacterized protein MELLADRAFT_59883 [Melampsora larici-populina 98AG31]EGG11213.1 hypothetical protein MELLADRAFT_59883 [Melampsora larici-populina 98AG31]